MYSSESILVITGLISKQKWKIECEEILELDGALVKEICKDLKVLKVLTLKVS